MSKEVKPITYRVMKTNEFKDSVFYKIECDCGSDDHQITLELCHDEDLPELIDLIIYKKLGWSIYWSADKNLFTRLWKRITGALTLLFKGYVEVEESFIFQGEEHIQSFLNAINEGISKIKHGGKTNKLRVNVEYIRWIQEERSKINNTDLENIDFYEGGVLVPIDTNTIERFKCIGLNNVDFILSDYYRESDS